MKRHSYRKRFDLSANTFQDEIKYDTIRAIRYEKGSDSSLFL